MVGVAGLPCGPGFSLRHTQGRLRLEPFESRDGTCPIPLHKKPFTQNSPE